MTSADHMSFSLTWRPSSKREPRLTTADLAVSIDGGTVWPVHSAPGVALEIQADDLLSHLTEFWKPLLLRQTFPVAASTARPSQLRAEAERRWAGEPTSTVERESERVAAFEEAHDLSRCFAGQFGLPPLWVFRSGDTFLVETADDFSALPFTAARDALEAVGNAIADRLATAGEPRWSRLLDAWRRRDAGEPDMLLAWSTGLNRAVAGTLIGQHAMVAPSNVTDAANDDELRIAARMASALPPKQVVDIIDLVRGFPPHSAPGLEALSSQVRAHIGELFSTHRPFEQGEAAARFVREALGFASVQYVDVFAAVEDLGISLCPRSVRPTTLDALAVNGRGHGPAVLLNQASSRIAGHGDFRRNRSARVTLAHELCHLLLDSGHTVSAVDVLNSRMPAPVEQRAKAFAGEFLLPGRIAADAWRRDGSPRSRPGLKRWLAQISARYGVTRSVSAWKLEHGTHGDDTTDLRVLLDEAVPQR